MSVTNVNRIFSALVKTPFVILPGSESNDRAITVFEAFNEIDPSVLFNVAIKFWGLPIIGLAIRFNIREPRVDGAYWIHPKPHEIVYFASSFTTEQPICESAAVTCSLTSELKPVPPFSFRETVHGATSAKADAESDVNRRTVIIVFMEYP